jgi:hypothetical protein
MTSAVCAEFSCTPAEAAAQDLTLCRRIMRLRRYAEAWQQIESGTPQKDLPNTPAMNKVLEAKIAIAKEERSGGR